ncbi:hypothetical protein [Ralstonia solanacearum]|nr:hypothetical protein [Ralstonia solanacearum]
MNQVETASSRLRVLIGTLVRDEFVLVSPDIKAQIERFEKKRRRDLLVDFDSRVAQLSGVGSSQSNSTAVSRGPLASAERLSVRAGEMLRTLAEKYIFKWTPNYRDTLQFIFAKALEELPDSGQLEREITAIGAQFASHSEEIFERGHKFQIRLGLSQDVALIKSISGVQTFLDVVISTYLDSRQRVLSAKEANVLWGLTSAAICGLVRGYGSVRLDGVSGWSLLGENMRSWVPPMGFCRATELLAFFDDFPATERAEDLRLVLGAAAYAVERIAHQFHGGDVLLPRWSRMSGGTGWM